MASKLMHRSVALHRIVLGGFIILALSTSACISMQLPSEFLLIDRSMSQLKAINPDEDKLWVRDFTDPDRGDLNFWRQTLKNDLTQNRGYVLLDEAAIKDGNGVQGVTFVVETTHQGRPMRELIAVFVYPGLLEQRIRVVELNAEKARFDVLVDEVRAAIATLQ
jgi:hypothetical protein